MTPIAWPLPFCPDLLVFNAGIAAAVRAKFEPVRTNGPDQHAFGRAAGRWFFVL